MSSRVNYLEDMVAKQRDIIEGLRLELGLYQLCEEDAWIKYVETMAIEDGGWECKCKKGLWGVVAPTLEQATSEGIHYFRQYYADGEYDG